MAYFDFVLELGGKDGAVLSQPGATATTSKTASGHAEAIAIGQPDYEAIAVGLRRL